MYFSYLHILFFTAHVFSASLDIPRKWGVVLYNSFDPLDITGPMDPLYLLSFSKQLNLSLIAEDLEPKYMRPLSPAKNRQNSVFQYSINPTHTFETAPQDLDVLMIPGGAAARLGNVTAVVDFVRERYPTVRYLISICTGAAIAARAGVLNGRRATTNKSAWNAITPLGPDVNWTSPARWVVDGNIWSSSGVTAGMDLIFAFIEEFYGTDHARELQGVTEFKRTYSPCDDPFAAWYNVPPHGYCY